ncbi:MAG: NADP-dependent isocitrate dehydrogenase [Oscillospiraceae bacterium]|nr:NADP-dependent isocitrate dehydrogenase [Oscillospiraceae bacterium]
MNKIIMENPIVEMDGDEMTRVLWQVIKDELIYPFVELNTEYYDLGLPHRDETDDQVTIDAAHAIKRLRVGVKCATITPNAQRVEEYKLKKMWKSPNGTIRSILDGAVFRAPILTSRISPVVRTWKKPITIARHAYGDVYGGVEHRVTGPGRAELHLSCENGEEIRKTIFDFEGPGVLQCQHNTDKSISSFARSCFEYAISTKQDMWFSTKDTISKQYDQTFKLLFQEIFDREYKLKFDELGINYFYTLIDDAAARVIRSEGGFLWACKNYDGDVMSDLLSAAFGSLAMMTSVLVSPDGDFEYEAAHGTITRHYYRYLKGEKTSSNPVATIFAWSGALRKRGEFDGNKALMAFADRLDFACLKTLDDGIMTGDLAPLCSGGGGGGGSSGGGGDIQTVDYIRFIEAIRDRI